MADRQTHTDTTERITTPHLRMVTNTVQKLITLITDYAALGVWIQKVSRIAPSYLSSRQSSRRRKLDGDNVRDGRTRASFYVCALLYVSMQFLNVTDILITAR